MATARTPKHSKLDDGGITLAKCKRRLARMTADTPATVQSQKRRDASARKGHSLAAINASGLNSTHQTIRQYARHTPICKRNSQGIATPRRTSSVRNNPHSGHRSDSMPRSEYPQAMHLAERAVFRTAPRLLR
jgi:hypothetical protein